MSSNRKKILWLASWYPNKYDPFDGDFIQRHARAAAMNHDIHVIFVKESEADRTDEAEWTITGSLTEQVIYFKKKKGPLARLQKQFTWRALFWEAIETYITRNGLPDLVHVHVPWKSGTMAMAVKKKYGINYVITEHWGIYNNVLDNTYNNKPVPTRFLLKQIFKNASQLITPSTYLGLAINKMVTPIDFTVIPNVVDTSLFVPEKEKYSTFTFIHVSNMVPLKNVTGILRAFNKALELCGENIQLILVGNRNNDFTFLAEQLGLLNKYVFFKGEVAYSEVGREMQLSHCFILNSYMENSPCVIGEALCCGLP
ncbi:MAG TPA: glycosyltransferase, partial [Chitinophagaceae bacterium]